MRSYLELESISASLRLKSLPRISLDFHRRSRGKMPNWLARVQTYYLFHRYIILYVCISKTEIYCGEKSELKSSYNNQSLHGSLVLAQLSGAVQIYGIRFV